MYKSSYPEIDSSTPNSFAYFIGWAYKNYTSFISFVLPDSILIKDYAKTRKLIMNSLTEIKWFENAGVPEEHRPFVYVDHDVCVINISKMKMPSLHYSLYRYNKATNAVQETKLVQNKTRIILEEYDFAFNLIAQDKDFKILNKIMLHTKLDDFLQCHEGIHTGNSRDILFIQNQKNKSCFPLYYGGSAGDKINNYASKTSGWYVDYRSSIIDKSKGYYASLRDERIFKYPKIYITRTGNPFKAFYDNNNYASNNFFSLQYKDYSLNTENALKIVLPFIISNIAQYFIRTFAAPRIGSTFIETKIFHLLKFRIPKTTEKQQIQIITEVNKILTAKEKDADADTSSTEGTINSILYKLYDFTEEEIAIIEGSVK